MFCPKCGTPNPDNAAFCSKCGTPLAAQQAVATAAQTGSDFLGKIKGFMGKIDGGFARFTSSGFIVSKLALLLMITGWVVLVVGSLTTLLSSWQGYNSFIYILMEKLFALVGYFITFRFLCIAGKEIKESATDTKYPAIPSFLVLLKLGVRMLAWNTFIMIFSGVILSLFVATPSFSMNGTVIAASYGLYDSSAYSGYSGYSDMSSPFSLMTMLGGSGNLIASGLAYIRMASVPQYLLYFVLGLLISVIAGALVLALGNALVEWLRMFFHISKDVEKIADKADDDDDKKKKSR